MKSQGKPSLRPIFPWIINLGLLGGLAALAPWQMTASGQESPDGLCCGLTAGCAKACTPIPNGSGSYEVTNHDYYSCQSYNSSLDYCDNGKLGSAYCGTMTVWSGTGCTGNSASSPLPRYGCAGSSDFCGEGA
jgi:hypothetical protein